LTHQRRVKLSILFQDKDAGISFTKNMSEVDVEWIETTSLKGPTSASDETPRKYKVAKTETVLVGEELTYHMTAVYAARKPVADWLSHVLFLSPTALALVAYFAPFWSLGVLAKSFWAISLVAVAILSFGIIPGLKKRVSQKWVLFLGGSLFAAGVIAIFAFYDLLFPDQNATELLGWPFSPEVTLPSNVEVGRTLVEQLGLAWAGVVTVAPALSAVALLLGREALSKAIDKMFSGSDGD